MFYKWMNFVERKRDETQKKAHGAKFFTQCAISLSL